MATAPASAPAVRADGKAVRALLESQHDRLAAVLPKHLSPERLIQVVSNLVYRTPRLQECTRDSIFSAIIQASELGLDLSPTMGEGYLIPRWNGRAKMMECQFQPGYKGLVALARRSGEIAVIQARVVREDDYFMVRYEPGLRFQHDPKFGSGSIITLVYAYAKLANGEPMVEVMTADEVEAIHRRSEGYKRSAKDGKPEEGPWVTDWPEMAKKTVLKRICKSLPRSIELARAIDLDDDQYGAPLQASARVTPPDQRPLPEYPSRSAALAASLEAPRTEPAPAEPPPTTPPAAAPQPDDDGEWPEGRE